MHLKLKLLLCLLLQWRSTVSGNFALDLEAGAVILLVKMARRWVCLSSEGQVGGFSLIKEWRFEPLPELLKILDLFLARRYFAVVLSLSCAPPLFELRRIIQAQGWVGLLKAKS